MEYNMFCYQCQETAGCTGCTRVGVCGKTPDVAAMQDLLVYVTKGLSAVTTVLRAQSEEVSAEVNHLITLNLFTTITNANFDKEAIEARITATLEVKRELLPKVDGIFAQTDLMAFGAMQALRVLGYTIPDQISLVGYDDIDLTRITHPAITTIHQPREEIARLTCENLLKVMKHADAAPGRQVVLQPTLVVRDSTRPLPEEGR